VSVEGWKSLFDTATVVLLFLTFAAGAGVLFTGNIINKRQEGKLHRFDVDLTGAKTELAKQQERAAKAEASIALAAQYAAEANTKAEGFKLEIAQANEAAARAQAQVASANVASKEAVAKVADAEARISEANRAAAEAHVTAERERLARLQLEARLADRVITPDQKQQIAAVFAPIKGQTVDVVIVGDTPEVSKTADAILGGLQNAGISLNIFHPLEGGTARGVIVGVRSDAPVADKQAGNQLVMILRETLGGGVILAAPDDFGKIAIIGTGTMGNTPGAGKVGKSTMRLQVAPK
jgi:hypothetical protein